MTKGGNEMILQAIDLAVKWKKHFYAYRMPGESKLHFGAQLIDQNASVGFKVHPFVEDSDNCSVCISAQYDAPKFIKICSSSISIDSLRKVTAENTKKRHYMAQADKAIAMLKSGELQKVVLSRVISAEYSTVSWCEVFKQLLEQNPNAFVFIFNSDTTGAWIGASPERYLSRHGEDLTTMALAGTRLAGHKGEWGAKEIEEQKFVSSYVAKHFEDAKIPYEMTPLFTKKAGNVEHLCNEFHGIARTISQVEAMRSGLHPTPALAGLPTDKAINFIQENELHDRRYYGGYIGPVDSNLDFDFFVNLRSMQFDEERYAIYVGGGLTADSEAEDEWQETVNKAAPLLKLL